MWDRVKEALRALSPADHQAALLMGSAANHIDELLSLWSAAATMCCECGGLCWRISEPNNVSKVDTNNCDNKLCNLDNEGRITAKIFTLHIKLPKK